MDYFSLVGISIGLAMDAFAVSITNGITVKNLNFFSALKTSLTFGFFQAFMPIIGWVIGKMGESIMSQIDHWIAFLLLLYIGGKMIVDVFRSDEFCDTERKGTSLSKSVPFKTLLMLSIATSIDALATGIILPSVVGAENFYLMILAVSIIGIITFVISFAGVFIGKSFAYFGKKSRRKIFNPNLWGGVILIFIGIKILFEHLFEN